MCNEIKCAVQENVQIGCTGNVHIAAVWMMGNNECVTVYSYWPRSDSLTASLVGTIVLKAEL